MIPNHKLCHKLLTSSGCTDDLKELIFGYMSCFDTIRNLEFDVDRLKAENKILEAENKILKEYPTGCGDPACGNGWGCLCYTR